MGMQWLAATALLGLAAANNVVSPYTKKCLDVKAMCAECDATKAHDDEEQGCDRAGCDREEASAMKKGTKLHMWACSDDENQDFEIIGGRVMNMAAGRESEDDKELCIDIKAMCQEEADGDYTGCDPEADPEDEEKGCDRSGCTRQSLEQIKEAAEEGGEADIQLWTCRDDSSKSKSFGNQKWDLLGKGLWKNEGTGLCLIAHHDDTESGADATNGAKVHVHKCPEEDEAVEDLKEFVFDYETGDMAERETRGSEESDATEATRLYSTGTMFNTKMISAVPVVAAAAGALALVGSIAAMARIRRSSEGESELPLVAE